MPDHLMRLLDANANRACEGLRTIEDYARLVREDGAVAAEMKSLRHRLTSLLGTLDRRARLASRAVHSDAGTENSSPQEVARKSLESLIPAACERITQAMRVLEEASKTLSVETALAMQELRYESYDALAAAELKLLHHPFPKSAQLYLLIDCQLELTQFAAYLRELSAAGVDIIQLRDKAADSETLVRYSQAAMDTLQKSETCFVVNDRVDVALAAGADGVHLGQEDMPYETARRLVGNNMWIGISTHDHSQMLDAIAQGADYIGCGPTFPSQTKSFDDFAGIDFLKQVVSSTNADATLPAFAIGGINLENIQAVIDAGIHRIAVSGAIHQSENPCAAASRLKELLRQQILEITNAG